jgi:hypothetical protein
MAKDPASVHGLRNLIEMRDVHGDTALNIASRIGDTLLIRNLVDVGADRDSLNNLGIRPSDFEVREEVYFCHPMMSHRETSFNLSNHPGCWLTFSND